MSARPAFWADDLDMDLLKLFPAVEVSLGPVLTVPLWTVGQHERSLGRPRRLHSTAQPRLNAPTVWNGHGAFIWLDKPNLPRDPEGWFNIHGCVSDDIEIECTWLELLRDEWARGYSMICLPSGTYFKRPPLGEFERLMYHIRGWTKLRDITAERRIAWDWVVEQNRQFAEMVWAYCLSEVKQQPKGAKT